MEFIELLYNIAFILQVHSSEKKFQASFSLTTHSGSNSNGSQSNLMMFLSIKIYQKQKFDYLIGVF